MRIISLAPAVTEILFVIGCGDEIVANTYLCDYPQQAKKIAKVGDFAHLDRQRIRSFRPDLVLSSTFVQNKSFAFFKNEKFKHIHFDPRSLADIYRNILDLGEITKIKVKARKIVNKMKEEAKKISKAQPKNKLRVYVEEWFDPAMCSGNWVPDLVKLAGGKNDLIKKGDVSSKLPIAKIIKYDPEVIFLSYCGFKDRSSPEKIYQRINWQNITAVKKRRIYPLDDTYVNRPGPRILEAARSMQRILLTLQ